MNENRENSVQLQILENQINCESCKHAHDWDDGLGY